MDQNILQLKKIFLIGFMGSGKTHWGRIWGKRSTLPFYDLDEVIEKEYHLSISKLFQQFGEQSFRKKEHAALIKISNLNSFILSCGGGTPCYNNSMKIINDFGNSIYLKCEVKTLFNRLVNDRYSRPLISNLSDEQLYEFIIRNLKEREVYYMQAKIILDEVEVEQYQL